MGTCNSGPKVPVLPAKTTDEGRDPSILVSQVLIALFCGEKQQVWSETHRDLLFWLFCMQKPQMRAGAHRDKYFCC